MAKKFRGPELIREIDQALDKGLARFVILTQGKLSKASPVDSGRAASSWFIGSGSPDRSTAAERPKGARDVQITKPTQKITMNSDHFISNNLPYAERICFDPKYAKNGSGGAAWFTTIVNNLGRDAEKSFDFFLSKVK